MFENDMIDLCWPLIVELGQRRGQRLQVLQTSSQMTSGFKAIQEQATKFAKQNAEAGACLRTLDVGRRKRSLLVSRQKIRDRFLLFALPFFEQTAGDISQKIPWIVADRIVKVLERQIISSPDHLFP